MSEARAICFRCGKKKKQPMNLCRHCAAVPNEYEEMVLSFCLSLDCIKPASLKNCRAYFREKNKPPKFKEIIIEMAMDLVEEHTGSKAPQSLEFSSAMFEFADDENSDQGGMKKVVAHIIGRRAGQPDDEPSAGLSGNQKTYHQEKWILGTDISQEQYESNAQDGEIYVLYRWINDRWTWMCVSQSRFHQHRALEDGHA